MYSILTPSGKNKRYISNAKKALDYYNSIKHLERTELEWHGLISILPENIYSLEEDKNFAKRHLKIFLDTVKLGL